MGKKVLWALLAVTGCSGSSSSDNGQDAGASDSASTTPDAAVTQDAALDATMDAPPGDAMALSEGGPPADASMDGADAGDATTLDAGACAAVPSYPDGGVCQGDCQSVTLDLTNPMGISAHGGRLYICDESGNVASCVPQSCATSTPLVTGTGTEAAALSAGDAGLFWASGSALKQISTASLDAGDAGARSLLTIAADVGLVSPDETTLVGNRLYWSELPDGIFACDVTNCAATAAPVVAPGGKGSFVNGLTSDGVSLFWTSMDNGWIVQSDLDGGGAHTLVASAGAPGDIAADPCNLYWIRFDGADTLSVMTCRQSSCDATTHVFATLPDSQFPTIAIDASSVYVIVRETATMFILPKP